MIRKRLSGKEIKQLNLKIEDSCKLENFIDKKDKVELLDEKVIVVNDKPCFIIHEGKIAPTLKLNMEKDILPKVTVDMPAVKFMVNGADVMRPGITKTEDFAKDDFVVIVDESHGKQLAIGQAIHGSKEIENMNKGKVLLNLHWVGDFIWNL